MDIKTLNDVATWMLGNIRLSRYDQQFVNNLTLYITQHNRITSNQDALFKKVALKYNRQFLHHKMVVEDMLELPWNVKVVDSIAEYTGASIKIENNQIIFRSPYNKTFLTALRKKPLYTLQWIKDKRQYEADYSPTVLKQLLYLSADHYSILNYCDTVTQIINSLSEYEHIKYWVPTLIYNNGYYYIAALNDPLYEAIKDIEINDDLKTIATFVKYGIVIDQSVKNHFLETEEVDKIMFATNFEPEVEIKDTEKILKWLHEFGCDAISEPKSFLTKAVIDISNPLIKVCKTPQDLQSYINPAIVYQKGTFLITNEKPMKLFKIIKFVNSQPIDLGPK